MKLISWNSNCTWNTKNGSWKRELLRREYPDADAVFLMEYPNDIKFVNYAGVVAKDDIPGVYAAGSKLWNDRDSRGVGLFCPEKNGKSFTVRSASNLAYPSELAFVCGYEFDCDGQGFRLACVWNYPKVRNGKRDYLGNAVSLIERAGEFLAGHKGILLGDFNITAFHESVKNRADMEMKTLSKCFDSQGLRWLDAEKPEAEKQTWFMHKDLSKGYAIDFCAVTKSMTGASVKLEYGDPQKFVLRGENGKSASDHVPLILSIK